MIENMTNEQAAECLKTIHVLSFKDETATFFLTDVQNAFKLAIKALEQRQNIHDKCKRCVEFSEFEQKPCEDWLQTFNTDSATECFTAVQRLKESVNDRLDASYKG